MRGEQMFRSPFRRGRPAGRVAGAAARCGAVLLAAAIVASTGPGAVGHRSGSTAQPAAAAEPDRKDGKDGKPRLDVPDTYFLAPAGKRGKDKDDAPRPRQAYLDLEIHNLGNGPQQDRLGRITLDVGGLAGKVAFDQDGLDSCKGYGTTKIDCSVDSAQPVFKTYLRALDSGRNGESGTLRYTYTPRKGKTRTATTRVVIGRPRLAVEQLPMRKGVEPTESVRVPVTFKNMGEVPARGVEVNIGPGWTSGEKHRNCRYSAASMTCEFPGAVVRPGETMTLDPVPLVRNPGHAMYEPISFSVRPLEGEPEGPDYGKPGRGSPLRLTGAPGTTGSFRGIGEPGEETLMYLQRPTRADYEATDIQLTEESDDRVRVRVGVRNNGPSSAPGRGELYQAKVTFPMGSTVLKTPRDENLEEDAELCREVSSTEYRCSVSPPRGRTVTFDFLLRPGFWGKTEVEIADSERFTRRDPRPENDSAAVATPAGTLHTVLSVTVGLIAVAAGVLALTRRRWWKRPGRTANP